MPISANNRVKCLSDHSSVVGLLAIFAYLLDMSKIGCGTIPCSHTRTEHFAEILLVSG